MKAAAVNFGCKVSQSDAFESLRHLVDTGTVCRAANLAEADLILVYCCCVTGRGAQKVRQRVRKLSRDHPQARVILCGCYPLAYPGELAKATGIEDCIPGHDPAALATMLARAGSGAQPFPSARRRIPAAGAGLRMQSRGLLKIQDGCPGTCTYCIVTRIRGNPSSMPAATVLNRLEHMVESGFEEIVTAGVNLASYGTDLSPPGSLTTLIRTLDGLPGRFRIRLSSLEPQWVDPELLDAIAQSRRVCPHFHLPLQSGDDTVLQRMRRGYSADQFRQTVDLIRDRFESFGLGTDLMVGFPGETDHAFNHTRALAEELPFTYFHVFRYSPRPGTSAAELPDDVPPAVKKERSRLLRGLHRKKQLEALKQAVGTTREAVVIKETSPVNLLTDTYHPVIAASAAAGGERGRLLDVTITHLEGRQLFGRISSPHASGAL